MALRPLLLSAVVGIAALGAFHVPAAKAAGSVSISIGSGSPYYGGGYYDRGYDPRYRSNYGYNQQYRTIHRGSTYYGSHRPGYTFVPGHWAYGQHGRVWVPDQYVPVRGYSGYAPQQRVIYRRAPQLQPLPGGFYHQRGGYDPHRGW